MDVVPVITGQNWLKSLKIGLIRGRGYAKSCTTFKPFYYRE